MARQLATVCLRSEVIRSVDLLVQGHHAGAQIHAEVVDHHVLTLQERRQELFREAISVLLVDLGKLLAVTIGRNFLLRVPLEHCRCLRFVLIIIKIIKVRSLNDERRPLQALDLLTGNFFVPIEGRQISLLDYSRSSW